MKKKCLDLLLIISLSTSYSLGNVHLKPGEWRGELQLRANISLPVYIDVSHSEHGFIVTIINGKEKIKLSEYTLVGDSIQLPFPLFNTLLIFKANSSTSMNGRWVNLNKSNYSIPFSASYYSRSLKRKEKRNRKNLNNKAHTSLTGKWEVAFTAGKDTSYPALGIFEQSNTSITGTFLTETGDYRFLQGIVKGTDFYLACFDGTHAFLFDGSINQDGKIIGQFYSGNHYSTTWLAHRNELFELNDPDSITFVQDTSAAITFQLKDFNNKEFHYPNEQTKDKVIILQLMGTWCPNCLDETLYFKKLYEKYHADGLEIISVAYEMGKEFSDYSKHVKYYKERLGIDYTLLIGGNAKKQLCHEQFPFLNDVVSFPTAIFIDRNGEIQRIHTGFSGPSTGQYYIDYMESTEELVKQLLKN